MTHDNSAMPCSVCCPLLPLLLYAVHTPLHQLFACLPLMEHSLSKCPPTHTHTPLCPHLLVPGPIRAPEEGPHHRQPHVNALTIHHGLQDSSQHMTQRHKSQEKALTTAASGAASGAHVPRLHVLSNDGICQPDPWRILPSPPCCLANQQQCLS